MCPKKLIVLCIGVVANAGAALAADFDNFVLRGSTSAPAYYDAPVQPRFIPGHPVLPRWDGLYIGGQVGYANSGVNFSDGVADLVANLLRNTTIEDEFSPSQWVNLPGKTTTRPSYGGFVGYNVQRDDIILGVEANYNRTDIRMVSGDTIGRVVDTSDGYSNTVVLSGTSSVHLTDYGTLRVRAGWVYDAFVPYGFAGFAVARATVSRSATVSIDGIDANPGCGPCLPPYSFSASEDETRDGAFAYGWALGAGLDWFAFSNVFLRGEYEYIGFAKFYGTQLHIHTVRTALGIRF
jgi:opacity protein-like surface antigen